MKQHPQGGFLNQDFSGYDALILEFFQNENLEVISYTTEEDLHKDFISKKITWTLQLKKQQAIISTWFEKHVFSFPLRYEKLQKFFLHIKAIDFFAHYGLGLSNLQDKISLQNGLCLDLTPKEHQLLLYLIQQPEKKASKTEILQNVWHYEQNIDTHTLETHVYELKKKILEHMPNLSFLKNQDQVYFLVAK